MKIITIALIVFIATFQSNAQLSCKLTPDMSKQLQAELFKLGGDISAAIIFPDGEIWSGTNGFTHDTITIKNDMLFNIGSITKTFTAATILKLADKGKLSLADHLFQWLPPYRFIDSTITLYQLLNHTSGVYDFMDTLAFYDSLAARPDKIWHPDEIIDRFVQEPMFKNGIAGRYSNTGYLLAGMIICKVTGKSLSETFREELLEPVALTHTYLYPDEGYKGDICDFDPRSQPYVLALTKASLSCGGAAGGLLSTPGDMVKWAKALYEGKVISKQSLREMTSFHRLSQQLRINYGLGAECYALFKDNETHCAYGHDGEWAHRSKLAYFPADSVAIMVCRKQDTYVSDVLLDLYGILCKYAAPGKEAPTEIKLHQNPPLSFSCSTNIPFTLQRSEFVTLQIFDPRGQVLETLVNKELASGQYQITWTPENLQAGYYYYQLHFGDYKEIGELQYNN
jgi:D-alanyl-D-alanine carboxypeptidase